MWNCGLKSRWSGHQTGKYDWRAKFSLEANSGKSRRRLYNIHMSNLRGVLLSVRIAPERKVSKQLIMTLKECTKMSNWQHFPLWKHQRFGFVNQSNNLDMEWNSLSRALCIFIWDLLKYHIVEFHGIWWSICSKCLLWTILSKQKSVSYFFKCVDA